MPEMETPATPAPDQPVKPSAEPYPEEEPVPRLPRGRFIRLPTRQLFRIAFFGMMLVVLVFMRKPCSEGVARFVNSFDVPPDAGAAPTALEPPIPLQRLTNEEIRQRFPGKSALPDFAEVKAALTTARTTEDFTEIVKLCSRLAFSAAEQKNDISRSAEFLQECKVAPLLARIKLAASADPEMRAAHCPAINLAVSRGVESSNSNDQLPDDLIASAKLACPAASLPPAKSKTGQSER